MSSSIRDLRDARGRREDARDPSGFSDLVDKVIKRKGEQLYISDVEYVYARIYDASHRLDKRGHFLIERTQVLRGSQRIDIRSGLFVDCRFVEDCSVDHEQEETLQITMNIPR